MCNSDTSNYIVYVDYSSSSASKFDAESSSVSNNLASLMKDFVLILDANVTENVVTEKIIIGLQE